VFSKHFTRNLIAIAPGHAAAASGGSFREAPLASTEVGSIMQALEPLLQDMRLHGRTELILSHQLAPVWLLPSAPVRLNWQETPGWVRDRLSAQFGELAATWRLAWEPATAGEPILASGVDAIWLDQLIDVLATKGIKLQRIQPWLSAACNQHRSTLSSGSSWLALAEAGRLTLAGFERGKLQTVRSGLLGESLTTTLSEMLARENLLGAKSQSHRVWLEAIHVDAGDRGRASSLDIRELAPASAGMAMMMGI
jgi:hypothetical protein